MGSQIQTPKELAAHHKSMRQQYLFNRPGSNMPATLRANAPGKQKAIAGAAVPPQAANSGDEVTKPPAQMPLVPQVARVISKISVAEVMVDGGCRVDMDTVGILVDSFRYAGQTSPILVVREDKGGFRVVSGAHRVAAARELRWDQIDAVVLDCDEPGQRLITIAEDLHRRDLSVLERAELTYEWIQLVRQEAAQVEHPLGGQQPNEKGLKKASELLGVSRANATRCAQIANISPEAKLKAKELGLHKNQSALLEITKLAAASDQVALLHEISERRRAPGTRSVTQSTDIEEDAKAAAVSASTVLAHAPEGLREGRYVGAGQQREDTPNASPEPYPDLLRGIDRRRVDAELEKLTDEWRSSRLLRMLVCAPLEARDRFIWEVLFSEFPDAFVTGLPETTKGGES
jgi:ParB family chromosome partitioning protein